MLDFAGVAVAAVTPFDRDGGLNEDALRSLIDWWISQGIRGIVACGSTGEAAYLSATERRRVIEIAVDQVGRRVPVIAGTGCPATKETIEITCAAAEAGADAALVVTPFFYPVGPDALFEHYAKIADASPIPILLYNNPQLTKLNLEAETVARLSQIPNIVGVKDSSGDWPRMEKILKLTGREFTVLSGSLRLLPAALETGADGGILAMGCLVPAHCVQLYELVRQGRTEPAQALHASLKELSQVVHEALGIPGLKAAMRLLNLNAGYPRAPLPHRLSRQAEADLNRALRALTVLSERAPVTKHRS
jgi:4-hydroxy-tetrahydrodipicolinate synthase